MTMNMQLNSGNEWEEVGEGQSPIRQFFRGRCVFITGATGFIGKILVEKILRCCPEVEKLYLLMRPKRGLNPEGRLQQLLKSELFSVLKKKDPSFHKKIAIIYGDLDCPNLGLSEEDCDIIRARVSVVFHSAARVRYDDHLRIAVRHHLVATKCLIELCRKMPKLAAFVYVSTAYVHRQPDLTVPERVHPCNLSPDDLLQVLEWMDDDTVSKITPFLLRDTLNVYFLTKILTENIIAEHCKNMPAAIVRPCVVCNTWKEPFPGWCDTIQGPSGLFLAAAKGFLRTLYSFPGLKLALIPADVVVNTMIAASWTVATKTTPELFVVNCAHDDESLPTAEELLQVALKKREEYPLANMYRYPDFTLYYSQVPYKIHSFFDQYLPAYFLDIFLYIFTGKAIMVKLYRKIESIFSVFVAVAVKPWIMKNENLHLLEKSLSGEDKKVFSMDMSSLDWSEYIDICMRGGRKFLAHEDPSNIPFARKKAKIWMFVTTVLKWILIFGLIYYIFSRYQMLLTSDI